MKKHLLQVLKHGVIVIWHEASKLTTVTCVIIPSGINGEDVRSTLLDQFGIEIASSFGPLHGKIWRIGTMGYSCRQDNVLYTLAGLEATLLRKGTLINAGKALQAALDVYDSELVHV